MPPLLKFADFPAFGIFTGVLHAWAVWMAFRFSYGGGAGVATLAENCLDYRN